MRILRNFDWTESLLCPRGAIIASFVVHIISFSSRHHAVFLERIFDNLSSSILSLTCTTLTGICIFIRMRYIAAYALLVVGGNAAPTSEQVFLIRWFDEFKCKYRTKFPVLFVILMCYPTWWKVAAVVVAAGGEVDEAQIALLFTNLEGKDIHELLAKGEIDLKSVTSSGGGGGGGAAPAGYNRLHFILINVTCLQRRYQVAVLRQNGSFYKSFWEQLIYLRVLIPSVS